MTQFFKALVKKHPYSCLVAIQKCWLKLFLHNGHGTVSTHVLHEMPHFIYLFLIRDLKSFRGKLNKDSHKIFVLIKRFASWTLLHVAFFRNVKFVFTIVWKYLMKNREKTVIFEMSQLLFGTTVSNVPICYEHFLWEKKFHSLNPTILIWSVSNLLFHIYVSNTQQ